MYHGFKGRHLSGSREGLMFHLVNRNSMERFFCNNSNEFVNNKQDWKGYRQSFTRICYYRLFVLFMGDSSRAFTLPIFFYVKQRCLAFHLNSNLIKKCRLSLNNQRKMSGVTEIVLLMAYQWPFSGICRTRQSLICYLLIEHKGIKSNKLYDLLHI